MTHSKDIAGLTTKETMAVSEAARKAVSEWTKVDLSLFAGGRIAASVLAALRPAADPKAEGLYSALVMIAHTETEDSFGGSKDMPSDWYRQQARDALAEYETALAPPTPDAERAGEPVAWMHPSYGWVDKDKWKIDAHCSKSGPFAIPLYASPQSPATEAVQVKPLEWSYFPPNLKYDGYEADSIVGRYSIPKVDGEHQVWLDDDEDGLGIYDTLDGAMRAAQADYEQRILAALIRPPVNNSPGGEHIVADVSKAAAEATRP